MGELDESQDCEPIESESSESAPLEDRTESFWISKDFVCCCIFECGVIIGDDIGMF